MKNRFYVTLTLAIFAFCVSAAPAAHAAQNFVSGNENNDGKFTPRKVYQPKDPNRQPGFWGKEWKRSGLSELGGAAKWRPFSDMGKFLKEKDEAVRAKRAGSDSAAVHAASAPSAIK